ncbi:MAG: hypothetical protein HUJ11_00495 [Arenibacter algicola]|nr:hypothetical protein [Arenibacter algicola]
MGVPNSRAEQIFRSIANPEDIAAFEAHMAPIQEDMEQLATNRITDFFDKIQTSMSEFMPHVEALASAGLTIDDMSKSLITRQADGTYVDASPHEKSGDVTAFINNTPEVRALYDQAWNRTTDRSWRHGGDL